MSVSNLGTAGFTPDGGTYQAGGQGRQQATVNALRTYQPPTAPGGSDLQRPDNSALLGQQGDWQARQQAEQAARGAASAASAPPPPQAGFGSDGFLGLMTQYAQAAKYDQMGPQEQMMTKLFKPEYADNPFIGKTQNPYSSDPEEIGYGGGR